VFVRTEHSNVFRCHSFNPIVEASIEAFRMNSQFVGRKASSRGEGGLLRTVDLARAAGISTQQVRNHEAAGVLPPVSRSATGHRQYTQAHLSALRTYRALLAGFGATAADIMRAVHGGDRSLALRLVDAAHAALHDQRLATDALDLAARGFQDTTPPTGPALRVGELAARLGVRASALRVWESAALLTPTRERGTNYRSYGPEQIRDARVIAMLRQGRYGFAQIAPVLDGLRQAGSTDALVAAIAERRAAHDERTRRMLTGAGLLSEYLAASAQ
jgi:DNA-binding transcriptional MerR regulator